MAIKAAMDEFISDFKSLSFPLPAQSKSRPSEDINAIKTKFLEAWNNFKFDLGSGTNVKKDSPLWLLGKHYHIKIPSSKPGSPNDESADHLHKFLMDYTSKPWFSYRKGFPPLEKKSGSLTTDTGWGCMLRTAQMMMAQCFITHFLGRDWRWLESKNTSKESELHRTIIKWFIDDPNTNCPFSIHQLTEIGLSYRFSPGDWYGPGTVAYIMQDATECAKGNHPLLNELVVYVAQDCTVYTEDVIEVCHWSNDTENVDHTHATGAGETSDKSEHPLPRSVIILIPVRLGEASLNPIYSPCLQAMLTLDQCMGIVGGKPKHSLYFVGFQDDHLFYLDPHYCQPADTEAKFGDEHLDKYHSMSPRKTHVSKLDPSCCLCFYCRDLKEFRSFVTEINKLLAPPNQQIRYPLCLIVEGSARQHKIKRDEDARSCSVISPVKKQSHDFTEIVLNSSSASERTGLATRGVVARDEDAAEEKDNNAKLSTASLGKKLVTSPRSVIDYYYRQRSRSPQSRKKAEKSLEEDFEFL